MHHFWAGGLFFVCLFLNISLFVWLESRHFDSCEIRAIYACIYVCMIVCVRILYEPIHVSIHEYIHITFPFE
jgi:hypothetical protein